MKLANLNGLVSPAKAVQGPQWPSCRCPELLSPFQSGMYQVCIKGARSHLGRTGDSPGHEVQLLGWEVAMGDTVGFGGCSRHFPPLLGIAILLQVLVTCRVSLICSDAMQEW